MWAQAPLTVISVNLILLTSCDTNREGPPVRFDLADPVDR